jgi:hypothetical protein
VTVVKFNGSYFVFCITFKKIGNKFSAQHLQFQKHKINVRLAAQTLSSSVANAIEFLDEFLDAI